MLLALAPGLRQTGWAVFDGAAVAASGVAAPKNPRKLATADRIAWQLETIAAVAARWPADAAARSRPAGINWPAPGLERLHDALRRWAEARNLPLFDYATQDVRAAVAGQPNASREAQCYAVMLRLGLIGQSRASAEWEAIAVGCCHLGLGGGRSAAADS